MHAAEAPTPEMVDSVDARTGEVGRRWRAHTSGDVEPAVASALAAHTSGALLPRAVRSALLVAIAERVEAEQDELVRVGGVETGLGEARLTGEIGRTCAQLRLMATTVDSGAVMDVHIDPGDAAAVPDLRSGRFPVGPVAVFPASNFPFAFGVSGNDTASALAAGCPVVVKGHPAHPSTGNLLSRVVDRAVEAVGVPTGTFAHLLSADPAVSRALVENDAIAAVGFTGSLTAGRALFDIAGRRPVPIPVYAEMGSTNPVVITRAGWRTHAESLAAGLATSVASHAGQLCTKPGVVLVPDAGTADDLANRLRAAFAAVAPHPMLSTSVRSRYVDGLARRELAVGLPAVTDEERSLVPSPRVLRADQRLVSAEPLLLEECFGPLVVVVACTGNDGVLAVLRRLPGQLTVSVFHGDDDPDVGAELLATARSLAGRVVLNGYPTGVQLGWAIHHGGPYPASTAGSTTSVGAQAVHRFTRPVVFQNAAQSLLPEELRDANPAGIWRRVAGVPTRADIGSG